MTFRKLLLLSILLSLAGQRSGAQSLGNLPLTNRQSILNDRAFLFFPANAVNSARSTDIMAADPDTNGETRIVLDTGKMRLVFFAEELYRFGDKNLLPLLSQQNGDRFSTRRLAAKEPLLAVVSTPLVFDTAREAILVNSLVVKTPDDALLRINAYVNKDGYAQKSEFQALTENVFATLANGTRQLNVKAHTELHSVMQSKSRLAIPLPQNFVVTKDKKYDFEVLKIQNMKPLSDTVWLNLTVYAGFHPSYFHAEYGLSEKEAVKQQGVFLNKAVAWLNFKNERDGFYLKEQIIPADEIEKGLVLHVAMLSSNKAGIAALTKLIGEMRLVNR